MVNNQLLNKVLKHNELDLLDLSNQLEYDPFLMKGMRELVDYLGSQHARTSPIRIIGDYDVDGEMSTKLWMDIGDTLDLNIDFYIPDRRIDNYGINVDIIEKAYKDGIKTVITCDNGIAAVNAVARAKELGMYVIITDHHRADDADNLPPADIIINPNQPGCEYPFKSLCGAGVVLKIMEALGIVRPDSYELATLATVCDVMDILDENRRIVVEGLKSMRYPKNFGLCKLCEELDLLDKDISTYHVGFVIGPHLNAAGRLEDASVVVELLTSNDLNICNEIVARLKALNEERQNLTDLGVQKAIKKCRKEDRINVIYLEEAEEGVIGIIAQRVVEYTCKPTFIFTKAFLQNSEDEIIVKGSGRSLIGYDMFTEVDNVSYLVDSFGGHEGAAGVSMRIDMLQAFKECLNESAIQNEYEFKREDKYLEIKTSDVDVDNIKSLRRLEPFGKGNPKPMFKIKKLNILRLNKCGANRDIIQFQLADVNKRQLRGVAFRIVEAIDKTLLKKYSPEEVAKFYSGIANNSLINVVGELNINEYQGKEYPQMIIRGIELYEE